MRVLFLTHAYPRFDGDPVGSFILRLGAALRDAGVTISVVAPSAPGVADRDVYEGIEVVRFRYAPARFETLAYTGTMGAQVTGTLVGKLSMASYLAAGLVAAGREARRTRADVLHAHWWFPGGAIGAALHAATGIPLVTTMHGSDVRLAAAGSASSLYHAVASRSAALTTVSSWLARTAEALDPVATPVVAPMPVRTELFFPSTERIADRLLFVGKLSEQKGLHHLLRAMARLRPSVTLDVVGAGRVPDEHLKALAESLGLASRVNWLPLLSQEELAALYRRAEIHVIPAVDEGLGLTAVESLLSETPVVAFDSGGIPDVVRPGETGVLVPAGDHQALATAIERLLEAPAERAALGAAGRRFALAEFRPEAVARRYLGLYERAVQRRRP